MVRDFLIQHNQNKMASKRSNCNMVDISGWIPVQEARTRVLELVKNGTYKTEEIRLSSQRFANKKDKSQGYEAKILVIPGIHPELESGLTYHHGTPRVVNKEVKEAIKEKKKPLPKLNFNVAITIDENKYQILEVINNKDRSKLFYWLRTKGEKYIIAEGPYDKNYKDVKVLKKYESEDADEKSFADWTLQCNLLTTHGTNPNGSDFFIPVNK